MVKVVTVERTLVQRYTLPMDDWTEEDGSNSTVEQIEKREKELNEEFILNELSQLSDISEELTITNCTINVHDLDTDAFMKEFGEEPDVSTSEDSLS